MARIANVEIGSGEFDQAAKELVARATTLRELQVLRKLVSLQGDKVKLEELKAKVDGGTNK